MFVVVNCWCSISKLNQVYYGRGDSKSKIKINQVLNHGQVPNPIGSDFALASTVGFVVPFWDFYLFLANVCLAKLYFGESVDRIFGVSLGRYNLEKYLKIFGGAGVRARWARIKIKTIAVFTFC